MRFKSIASIGAFISAMSLSLSSIGCEYKTGAAKNPHAKSKGEATGTNSLNISNPAGNAKSEPEIQNSSWVLSKVEAEILNTQYIVTKQAITNDELKTKLDWYNREILRQTANQQNSTNSFLKYQAAVLFGCSPKLEGCRTHQFFSKSAFSYRVVLKIAETNQSNLETYYQLLNAAYVLKNRMFDFDLSYLYLKHADSYLRKIQNDEEKSKLFISLLQTILSELSESATSEQAQKGLDLFSPISLSRNSNSVAAKLNLAKIFSMGAKLGIFYKKGNLLSDKLTKELSRIENEKNGFWWRQSQLIKGSKQILALGEIKPIQKTDEYFFLVDRIFNGHLLPQDGLALWQGVSGEDRHKKLVEIVKNYVKIQFMHYLNLTNLRAKEVFDRDVSSDQVLEYAISHSFEISSIWDEYRRKLKPLSAFVISTLNGDHASEEILTQAKDIVEGLETNIKISSTYPHMMMLAYLMSLKDFKKEYRSKWGIFTIDSSIVLNSVFSGAEPPEWLDYSEDHAPLNQNEVIYAFDIAVKTGTIDAFGVDPDKFLKQIFLKLQAKSLVGLESFESHMTTTWASSEFLKIWKPMCANLRSKRVTKRVVNDLDTILISPFMADLQRPLLNPTESALDMSKKEFGGTSIYAEYASENLEVMRLNLLETERLMRSLLMSFETSGQKIDLTKARAELKRIADFKTRFANSLLGYHNELGRNCYSEMLAIEFETGSKILQFEEQYLRHVYRDIMALRSSKSESEKARITNNYLRQLGPLQSRDRISEDGYHYNLIDLTFRVIEYMKSIRPEMEFSIPINMTQSKIVKSNSFRFLQNLESEDQFVKEGLSAGFFATGRGPLLTWFTSSFRTQSFNFKQYFRMLFGLYKLQPGNKVNFGLNIDAEKIITPSQIIEEIKTWTRLFNLSDLDKHYLEMMQYRTKFNLINFSEVFFRTDNPGINVIETYGLFDYIVDGTQQEVLGSDYRADLEARDGGTVPPKIHTPPTLTALGYLNTRREASQRIYFKTSSKIDDYLFASHKEHIQTDEILADQFLETVEKEVAKLQTIPLSSQPYFDVDRFTKIQGLYISPRIVSNYEKNRKRFHDSTENCFKENTTCTAFRIKR